VFDFKKDRLKDKFILLLLALFVLIKVSPLYYAYQYAPQFNAQAQRETLKISKTDNQHHYLVKVDKSIVEEVSCHLVPAIKFSGVPFTFFFLTSMLVSFILGPRLRRNYPPLRNDAYLNFCILRL
jgi:hypothetical protein